MKTTTNSRQHRLWHYALCSLLVGGAGMTQSCKDEILEGQPDWLGNSIYERLDENGNYTTVLKLIDDLGQHDVLSQTGSKTLFVADDAAFNRWYQTNSWGVRSYSDLSQAQKKLLLNNSMVNNAYLIELLSNVSGNPPEEGMCMRRATAVSIYDSVPQLLPAQMPQTVFWDAHRHKQKGIHLLKDNTTAPMIHFLPAYMRHNKITAEDLSILTNGEATSVSEAWVNGKKVTERDITCKNGYVQKVEGVIESSPNMAEILRQHQNMSRWSQLIDRFSAPYYDESASENYQRLYGTDKTDSVYVLRYFSNVGIGGAMLNTAPDGTTVDATLAYDPGWNQYMYTNTMGYDLHYDAGAMIVPTDVALNEWWTNGGGKALKDEYGTWDNVPQLVLAELLNNNMLDNFSEHVPSKFSNILNDAKMEMGITPADVDSCFMGCNGVVYLVNKVFAPASYSSVSFPALVHQSTMSAIYWAIKDPTNGKDESRNANLNFAPYLNSMDTYYSLILPSNNSMLLYVDPASYGTNEPRLLAFYYDNDKKRVTADRYACTITDGVITPDAEPLAKDINRTIVENRLIDILDNMIIVGNVEDGHTYYKTKGGNIIKVENAGQEGQMAFYGGWQIEQGGRAPVQEGGIYDQYSSGGNGKSYVVDQQMPMTAAQSVYQVLRDTERDGQHPFEQFFQLIVSGDSAGSLMINEMGTTTKYSNVNPSDNMNVSLFANYNYTVFVPTNETIQALIDQDILPTWADYELQDSISLNEDLPKAQRAAASQNKKMISNRIFSFLRYHIQDNAILIGSTPDRDADGNLVDSKYETALVNPDNNRFYTLELDYSDSHMKVTDVLGNQRNVLTSDKGLYNRICREYWFAGSGDNKTIYQTSSAVVHQIDGVLMSPVFYKDGVMTKWTDQLVNYQDSNE